MARKRKRTPPTLHLVQRPVEEECTDVTKLIERALDEVDDGDPAAARMTFNDVIRSRQRAARLD